MTRFPVTLVVGSAQASDALSANLLEQARSASLPVTAIANYQLFHLDGSSETEIDPESLAALAETLVADPVDGWWCEGADRSALCDRHPGVQTVIDTGLRPGVTDREGAELVRAAQALGYPVERAGTGRRFLIEWESGVGADDSDLTAELARRVLHNEVVERWGTEGLAAAFADDSAVAPATTVVAMRDLDPAGLQAVNAQRRLGLDPEELVAIRDHFARLGRDPSDAELETLAQTWSEHCAHKTFRAQVTVENRDGTTTEVDGLLASRLRAATDEIGAPWVRSAFVDNAGIVAFEPGWDIALKAETHNHPSALEPFGGANTGVGGVVRDILGVSARPVAITDVLCFGPEDLGDDQIPDGVLHPRRIRDGVIAGVGDYGNKIGVPTVAGAIVHDESYTTTPLVFAGCVGVLPSGSNPTEAQPGDQIVVLGGAVGRDGVGGATFSSQTMGAETADIAGSSVQIGDPIVEKGLIDVVVAARDRRLYTAITDCGAGGLSSSVGEMAETVGAEVDLATVPRKYPGLAPWEVWLSEAQERMVVAAPDPEPLLALAETWGVGATVIGRFTGDGRLVVTDGGEPVIDLDCAFLHDGRPRRQMQAIAPDTSRPPRSAQSVAADGADTLLGLLAHPSIRSNEDVVRTYDHEVLGGTRVRPYAGAAGDGAADGTVIVPPGTSGERGLAIGVGVNAVVGQIDPGAMAWSVIDEAVRNVVVAGGDPHELSLLDNFAWGNPTDPETLGGLVAACDACHDASLAFGAPFVSGKDSLYNVFVDGDGTPDPVAPTLVITATAPVRDLSVLPLTGVAAVGDDVWLVGPADGALGGSHFDDLLGEDLGGPVAAPDPDAVRRHHAVAEAISGGLVRSVHDISEGGVAVAAAEWAFAGRLGLDLDLGPTPEALFGEGPGRYLVEIRPEDADRFGAVVNNATRIGSITGGDAVRLGPIGTTLADIGRALLGSPPVAASAGASATASLAKNQGSAPDRPAVSTFGHVRPPRVLLPVAPGTNRDGDLAQAFTLAGAVVDAVPLMELRRGERRLDDYQLLGLSGGFSYGDALGAGRLLGLDLSTWFAEELARARDRDIPIIGICNGFQALVRAGLLPGSDHAAVLTANRSKRFECRWVALDVGDTDSVWTTGLDGPLRCPVAHGEGRFVAQDLDHLVAARRVAFRYLDPTGEPANGTDGYPWNPNGSEGAVAGVVDDSGLVLGLMPHPENHVLAEQDPLRGRRDGDDGNCLGLFRAGVAALA